MRTPIPAMAVTLALFIAVSQDVVSGDIVGTVTIATRPQAEPAKSIRGIYSGGPAMKAAIPAAAARVVVFIADHPAPDRTPQSNRYAIAQEGMQFKPNLLAIMAGSVVDFPNNDTVYHNVFSYSLTRRFDLGRYEKGKSKSVTFNKPGIVRVFCEIHSHMRANILVLENPWFTIAEHNKPYRISDVPTGTYTLTVWHERLDQQNRAITLPADGQITIDFSL